jgi:hypothetical protein
MADRRLYDDLHRLYARILRQQGPQAHAPLATMAKPDHADRRAQRFDAALHRAVVLINRGADRVTLRYEGDRRWSMMGSVCLEWLEFEYLGPRQFKVTRLLRDASAVNCSFRNRGANMEEDIWNACRIFGAMPP